MQNHILPAIVSLGLLIAPPTLADEASDAIAAAQSAYAAGNLKAASEALQTASRAIAVTKGTLLTAALPPAPDGWTREDNTSMAQDFASIGGGTGAESYYAAPDGTTIKINMMTDSPMVTGMMGMFATEQMMAMMGKVVDLPGVKMIEQDNSLLGIVDGRLLVQIDGAPVDQLMPLAAQIDFEALARFDTGN
jgi:hypothetical protein